MKKPLTPMIALVFVVLLSCSLAQAGSSYSRFGYGLLYLRDGVKAIAMGGTGLAISDSVTIFYLNPAALASIRTTHIQGAALYDRATMTLDNQSALFHEVNVNGLGILIPLKRGYAMAFGFQPYSQVNYEVSDSSTVDGKDLEQSLTGDGGLDVFYLALASTIGPVQFGVTADFYFGLISETWRVNFSSGDLTSTDDRISTNFRGFGVHAGLQMNMKNWQWGLAAGTPVNLSGETRVDTRFDTDDNPKRAESKLPFWLGLGMAYRPSVHWQFAAEARVQQWGMMSKADLLGASGVNNHILGFGLEFTPGSDRLRDGKGLHYRAGANYGRLPYREANGKTIPEWSLAAGFGVPFNRGASSVDFAVEWGKRGNSENLVQENILRFSMSINGSERWFQRRR
ncbi:MAG: hypothetical protein ACREOO_32130 [bacterium]